MQLGPAVRNIGRGAFGNVTLHQTKDGKEVVKKELRDDSDSLSDDIVREISSLSVLRGHPNIVQLLETRIDVAPFSIILEKAEESLDVALKMGHIGGDNTKTRCIMYHISRGLRWMSNHGIWHRDLKTPNILLMADGRATIADFGLSRGGLHQWTKMTQKVFSIWWRPPEILLQEYSDPASNHLHIKKAGIYGPETELWALGICFWNLVCGKNVKARTSLEGFSIESQLRKLLKALDRDDTAYPWQQSRKIAYENLSKLSTESDKDRWSKVAASPLDQTVRSELEKRLFFALDDETYHLLSGLLCLNPEKRMKIEELLDHRYFKSIRCSIDENFPIPAQISSLEFPRFSHQVSQNCMRIILEWYSDIREDLELEPDIFFLTIAILDEVFSKIPVGINQYQLAAVASLGIAYVYHGEQVSTESQVDICANTYSEEKVIQMSKQVFLCVHEHLHLRTAWSFLREKQLPFGEKDLADLLFFVQTSEPMLMKDYSECANFCFHLLTAEKGDLFPNSEVLPLLKTLAMDIKKTSKKNVFVRTAIESFF